MFYGKFLFAKNSSRWICSEAILVETSRHCTVQLESLGAQNHHTTILAPAINSELKMMQYYLLFVIVLCCFHRLFSDEAFPTPSPSSSPTIFSTSLPTTSPTILPSAYPTVPGGSSPPSQVPTYEPTATPTVSSPPTWPPTKRPSFAPFKTATPTFYSPPTSLPTFFSFPTPVPTFFSFPTPSPTFATFVPTRTPSFMPTFSPSFNGGTGATITTIAATQLISSAALTVAQAQSGSFQTALISGIQGSVPGVTVTITSVTSVNRRHLLGSVIVGYTVASTYWTASTLTSSLTNSPTIQAIIVSLSNSGFTGITVSTPAIVSTSSGRNGASPNGAPTSDTSNGT